VATFLSKHLYDRIDDRPSIPEPSEKVRELREELIHELEKSPAGKDGELSECIRAGIAFHNAGLLLEERRVVEDGIRSGVISVVVATTTLSAGMNIRTVSRVIIYSPYRRFSGKTVLLSNAQFAQMAGRTGRNDEGTGDVIIIARSDREKRELLALLVAPLPSITTQTSTTNQIYSYILQALSLGLATDFFTLRTFLASSFEISLESDVSVVVTRAMKYLNEKGMCEKFRATTLGQAVTAANVTIEDGLALCEQMQKFMRGVCLFDDLHLMVLCTPTETGVYCPAFSDAIWESIFKRHRHVIGLITGKTPGEIDRFIIQGVAGRLQLRPEEKVIYEKIFAATILVELIQERPLTGIEKEFEVDRGTIQTLQTSAASFAGQGAKFAEAMGYHALNVALLAFLRRLTFGVKEELIELMSLPSMRRDLARRMFDQGVRCAEDMLDVSVSELVELMPHGEGGMTGEDKADIAERILKEAAAVCDQIAMLEKFEEESAWTNVMKNEDDDRKSQKRPSSEQPLS
jgi:replicative superfamily II helicase